LKDRNVFREQNATSNWRYAKHWGMPSCVAIRQIRRQKYTCAAAADPGNEISIVVTHQGKGSDVRKTIGNGLTSEAAEASGRGTKLIRVATDKISFERICTEVHNGGTVRSSGSLKAI
jgi:anti-sigma regulatory factor (Ser/Thr protein kinase)